MTLGAVRPLLCVNCESLALAGSARIGPLHNASTLHCDTSAASSEPVPPSVAAAEARINLCLALASSTARCTLFLYSCCARRMEGWGSTPNQRRGISFSDVEPHVLGGLPGWLPDAAGLTLLRSTS
eukprot:CAMPEP_0119102570 /NCGR_PEP_ID=MMETSP1180-20130426/1277_1 /TAXON_ID=3052 ORGANISM="Chlamydomonas cf sp, Strain CCMP681" /NCGR_SAMPLE_ID=MMETSP1180 /ASSEMBLY_ACC=CAM_ASM_000741 /LENGTH=125 /DNA_ID=CAMNT_0007086881 /DNA_START=666 /DNA_END=1043 /DNA_ORIENTATION=+